MISFRDFAPRQVAPAALFKQASYESLDEALADANDWIARKGVTVLNVETVVLPNLNSSSAEGTEDPNVVTNAEFLMTWNQFIRVWYNKTPLPENK